MTDVKKQSIDVGILMGSDSDLGVMEKAIEVLKDFGIGFEVSVLSAHRTPHDAGKYAETAKERGLKVLIAGAGGAAHLPGVIASLTTLPVIGVPVKSVLSGVDSLYSIAQMPSGIPVATVGVDGAKNAALLAVAILAVSDKDVADKLKAYRQSMAQTVREKNERVREKYRQ